MQVLQDVPKSLSREGLSTTGSGGRWSELQSGMYSFLGDFGQIIKTVPQCLHLQDEGNKGPPLKTCHIPPKKPFLLMASKHMRKRSTSLVVRGA